MRRVYDVDDVRRLIDDGAQIVEVLPAAEYDETHLPGAVNIPLETLTADAVAKLDPARTVVVYCFDFQCDLSPRAAARLEWLGFKDVVDYVPGKAAWLGAGHPTEGRLLDADRIGAVVRQDIFYVEDAELLSRPAVPPPIMVAAGGRKGASLAGRIGDGLIGVAPTPAVVDAFEAAGGSGKPRVAQVHLCWAADADNARRTAYRWWPNALVSGAALTDLARPKDFEALTKRSTPDDIADVVVCGPDVGAHAKAIESFVVAGFDEIYLHQIGPDQRGFLRFYREELAPRFI